MKKIFLGIGSNVGDRKENIYKAISLLKEKITDMKVAPIYISKAVGYENQANFFNTVVRGFTKLSPYELLSFTQEVERKTGRIYRFKWGPREIDIDILFYEDLILKTDNLTIPHQYAHKRDFVLLPLIDLEEDFIHPVLKKSVKEILEDLKEKSILGKIKEI